MVQVTVAQLATPALNSGLRCKCLCSNITIFCIPTAFVGGKDDGLTSSLMWLRDSASSGFQSLNFGGLGSSPWMQPRLDNSLLGLQPDMYQTIAAAADLQSSAKKISPAVMQFQQPHNTVGRSALLSSHNLQQGQPQFQQLYHQNVNDRTTPGHSQPEYIQQLLQHCQSFNEQKPHMHPQQQQHESQHHHQRQQGVQSPQNQQIQQEEYQPNYQSLQNALPMLSQFSSASQSPASTLPKVSAFSHQQNIPGRNSSSLTPSDLSAMHEMLKPLPLEAASRILGVARTHPVPVSDPWSSKRFAVESVTPSGPIVISPQIEQLDSATCNVSQSSVLAPLPGRECLEDEDRSSDPPNHLLFGTNIDSQSLLMQAGIQNLQNDTGSRTIQYSTSNFLGPSHNDFPLNQALTNSGCIDESGYVPCAEGSEQVNEPPASFVKVSDVSTSWTTQNI
jgi:hypothetical protein